MKLNTKHFGEIDVEESKFINFSEGIPGFPHLTNFVLMAEKEVNPQTNGVFYWLQSAEDAETAFVLVDMVKYSPEYNPLVEENEIEGLGDYDPDKFFIYNIAVIPENVKEMTVNLKAPLVINTELKKGKQIVCTNDEYSVRHYMFK